MRMLAVEIRPVGYYMYVDLRAYTVHTAQPICTPKPTAPIDQIYPQQSVAPCAPHDTRLSTRIAWHIPQQRPAPLISAADALYISQAI